VSEQSRLEGVPLSKGIAFGQIHVLTRAERNIPQYYIGAKETKRELQRLRDALGLARSELHSTRKRMKGEKLLDPSTGAFLDLYEALLEDESIVKNAEDKIRRGRMNAEWALQQRGEEMSADFETVSSEYLRERKHDIEHLVAQVIHAMRPAEARESKPARGAGKGKLLAARTVSPSEAGSATPSPGMGESRKRERSSASFAGIVAAVAPVEPPAAPMIPGRRHEPEREYVVASGDTLYSIAWRHGIDYRALAGFNSIRDPSRIFPGQRLRIPQTDEIASTVPEPSTARSEPAASGEVSVRGIGTQPAPEAQPLPVPESAPSVDLPDTTPPEASTQQPVPAPVSKPPAEPTLETRVVEGLSWSRPTSGKKLGSFGRGGNNGLDIAGTFEQPVWAASRGQVVYAGSGLVGYGKLVIVKHDDRLLSAYAHNERLRVGEGDEVQGGQHIADMGRSGKGRVMLHFEIRRDGKPVDPVRFLP